jgi:hypothetical protein
MTHPKEASYVLSGVDERLTMRKNSKYLPDYMVSIPENKNRHSNCHKKNSDLTKYQLLYNGKKDMPKSTNSFGAQHLLHLYVY